MWNEPNGGFWSPPKPKGPDPTPHDNDYYKLPAYLQLYEAVALNLRKASPHFQIGGAATLRPNPTPLPLAPTQMRFQCNLPHTPTLNGRPCHCGLPTQLD